MNPRTASYSGTAASDIRRSIDGSLGSPECIPGAGMGVLSTGRVDGHGSRKLPAGGAGALHGLSRLSRSLDPDSYGSFPLFRYLLFIPLSTVRPGNSSGLRLDTQVGIARSAGAIAPVWLVVAGGVR